MKAKNWLFRLRDDSVRVAPAFFAGRARISLNTCLTSYNQASLRLRTGGDEAAADPVKGKQAFIERCSACHSVGTVVSGGNIGPDLAGVYGRRAGSQAGFGYSAAMAALPQTWGLVSLDLLLTDSGGYVQGTTMAAVPVSEPEVRRQIIEFLKQQSAFPSN